MRSGVRRLIVDRVPLEDVLRSFEKIINPAERRSARDALGQIAEWRSNNAGDVYSISPVTYESPNGLYKVRFEPDFGIALRGRRTAIHVWNTKSTVLSARNAQIGLALFPELYDEQHLPQTDLAVLSLPNRQLYQLTNALDFSIAARATATGIEMLIESVRDELRLPAPPSPDHRAPPPATR